MKREKRLKKGIESIGRQIEVHKEKLREAAEKGDNELVIYYEKELISFEKEEGKKKEQLKRKK